MIYTRRLSITITGNSVDELNALEDSVSEIATIDDVSVDTPKVRSKE